MENRKIGARMGVPYDDRKRVLVVDDNPILLRTAKEMLDEQYQVGIAVSAEQAFTSISRNMPDIILLDYEMPFTNGIEVLKQLRGNDNTKNIPVIFGNKEVCTCKIAVREMVKILRRNRLFQLVEIFTDLQQIYTAFAEIAVSEFNTCRDFGR